MTDAFFEAPILNSPYEYPERHWELDEDRQPTTRILDLRRPAAYITPVPRARKQRGATQQAALVLDEGKGLSSEEQEYDPTSTINVLRREVDLWRASPEASWNVTPETARLLKHWRDYDFSDIRPFFCQVEAVETGDLAHRGRAEQSGRREVREILERLDVGKRAVES